MTVFPLSQISSLFSRTKGSNQDEYNEKSVALTVKPVYK